MKPSFILGYSKSGTSLLVALLDGHPEINVIPEESDYFDGTYFLVKRLIQNNKLSIEEKVDIIYNQLTCSTHISNLLKGASENDPRGNFDYSDFKKEEFEKEFKSSLKNDGISHQNVFSALASAYNSGIGNTSKQKIWLEKTPYHDLNVANREELLERHFEDYKVVHIFRDPRDNFLAYSKKRPELNIYDICYEWKRVSNLALNWKNKENNLIIRYEDLVLDTNNTMNQILSFLDLKPDERIYEPTKNGVPWTGNSMFGQKSTKISSDRVERYLKMLDPERRNIIETHCSEEMKKLNYLSSEKRSENTSLPYHLAKMKSSYKGIKKRLKVEAMLKYKY